MSIEDKKKMFTIILQKKPTALDIDHGCVEDF